MMTLLTFHRSRAIGFTVRTDRLSLPTNALQVRNTIICSRKAAVNFDDGHTAAPDDILLIGMSSMINS